MSYFIFLKNLNNISGTLYRIAENNSDLNSLNINKEDYTIIEDSLENFNAVKYGLKFVEKYNNDIIIYVDSSIFFKSEKELLDYINNRKNVIETFLNNNKNHSKFNTWNSYYTQLTNLNTSNITYPLNKSLEQYFNDLNQLSLNTLQLP